MLAWREGEIPWLVSWKNPVVWQAVRIWDISIERVRGSGDWNALWGEGLELIGVEV